MIVCSKLNWYIVLVFHCRCDKEMINSSGQSAADIARFWNHKEALEILEPSKDAPQPAQFKHYKHVNFFGHGVLDRASDKRKDKEWLDEARKTPQSKYILLSDLQAVVIPLPDFSAQKSLQKFRLLTANCSDISTHVDANNPLVILLGIEHKSEGSEEPVVWFAVDVTGMEDVTKLHAQAEMIQVYPGLMALPDRDAGIVAQARAVMAWHDRYVLVKKYIYIFLVS